MNLKDKSITTLVEKVLNKFTSQNIKIEDYWDADLCAIGFTGDHEGYLVYVSTDGKNENEYFVSLEVPSIENDAPYETKANYEKVTYPELEKLIFEHLISR